jgi:enoyl-CoA hydratase/carnithine racemase
MTDYRTLTVTTKGAVATVTMLGETPTGRGGAHSPHSEVGMALDALRFDNGVRVVVLTGSGDIFCVSPPGRPRMQGRVPSEDWDLTQGMQRTYSALIEMEKPVIAKINGVCSSFGMSLCFACDFIVAREDAAFCDPHIGMAEGKLHPAGRPDTGVVPGDGSTVFVPLHLRPPLAREFLWLSRQFTGRELAEMNVINAAVPMAELDARADAMAEALLRRPAYALALSKRAFNRFIAQRFNLVYDLAWAYEALNFYQYGRYKDGRGDETL